MRIRLETKYAKCPNAIVRWARYGNGNVAMRLMEPGGEQLMVPTVNMGKVIPTYYVVLKTWGENEGIEESLKRAGVIENDPIETIDNGHVKAPVYHLSYNAMMDLQNSERNEA